MKIWRKVTMGALVLWSAFPIYWALNTSLMTNKEAQANPVHFFPSPLSANSYKALLRGGSADIAGQFWHSMLNAGIESVGATILTLVVAVACGYALGCLTFVGKRVIFVIAIFGLVIPVYATLIPTYRILIDAHLINTYLGIILVYAATALPLAVWLMYNFFKGIPYTMIEACAVDGAGPTRTLLTVMLPLARTGVVATAIISFLSSWSQFIFPLVLSTDLTTEPVTVFITSFEGRYNVPFTLINASAIASLLVPVIIVIVLNRHIVAGVLEGSYR